MAGEEAVLGVAVSSGHRFTIREQSELSGKQELEVAGCHTYSTVQYLGRPQYNTVQLVLRMAATKSTLIEKP